MKFHEVQTDITLTNHSGLDQVVLFNNAWYNALPEDVKGAIVEGVKQGGRVCLEETLKMEELDAQLILETGKTTIHELTEEQKQAWREAVKPVQEFARSSQGEQGEKLYDMIVEAIAQINSK